VEGDVGGGGCGRLQSGYVDGDDGCSWLCCYCCLVARRWGALVTWRGRSWVRGRFLLGEADICRCWVDWKMRGVEGRGLRRP